MTMTPQAPRGPDRRPRIALQEEADGEVAPRVPTRLLGHPWPFPQSVVPGRGLVRNVQPHPKRRESP